MRPLRELALAAIAIAAVLSCGGTNPAGTNGGTADPPVVASIRIATVIPITTYTIVASDPAGGTVTATWEMTGEPCGTPRVPWTQTGMSVTWSHSDNPPDSCTHETSDHNVFVTVTVTTQTGPNRGAQHVCKLLGTGSQFDVISDGKCDFTSGIPR